MSAREPAPQMIIAGRFRIERELGRGGMGSVWLSTHLGLETAVAVKFMTAGASAEAKQRFHREAKAAAQIRSSNVVQILDYGIDDDLPYIAMELLEGEDLRARLKRVRRLSLADAYAILLPIARGLARAHEAHLVHRDLKPENIFLTREGETEIPKILDFGIAKALRPQGETVDDVATQEGTVLGTPYYMSPEQARGRLDVDHRSDLWSLGVILYQLLTGKRPFASKVMGELILQICSDPIPPASSVAPDLPPAVDAFFETALARDPADRFQSARAMTEGFAELVRGGAQAISLPDIRFSLPPAPVSAVTPPPALASVTVGLPAGPARASRPDITSTGSLGGAVSSARGDAFPQARDPGAALPARSRIWAALGLVGAVGMGVAGTALVLRRGGSEPAPLAATTAPSALAPASAMAPAAAPPTAVPSVSPSPTATASATASASGPPPASRPRPAHRSPAEKPKRDMGY